MTMLVAFVAIPSFAAQIDKCANLVEIIKQNAAAPNLFMDSFTFQKDGRGDQVLLLFKDKAGREGHVGRWIFLTRREKDSLNFCVNGEGEEFGLLADMHSNSSEKRFGMPGSGNPRCSTKIDALPASLLLRMWANRELGQSTILYVSYQKSSGFQFLISADNHWVVIEDEKSGETSVACYFERGDGLVIRQDSVAKN